MLKLSSSFLDKCFQMFRLNFIFLKVILLSILASWVPKSIFSTTFLSSHWTKMCWKKNRSVCGSISKILYQWVPFLSELSVFTMTNGYFPFFSKIIVLYSINLFMCLAGKNSHNIVIYVWIIDIFQGLFYLKIAYSLVHFAN